MIESGRLARLVVARVKPNEDLVTSLEHLCDAHEIERALVRSAVGSLLGATLLLPQRGAIAAITVDGPGVESVVAGVAGGLHHRRSRRAVTLRCRIVG
ncbi:DNA-binding protein [Mycetohabitans sp. B8]|uniref:PCC domain-containing protein n=1 Tax=Mycetohabitans sp. B8 TaxID=2841845 RepID=UPI001F2D2BFA|nr:DUF296 domain-containing protein [Mycetohabitans sp. B8]MCG1041138.1 DNA-binding protein [Mycetohabitans sp. B8]